MSICLVRIKFRKQIYLQSTVYKLFSCNSLSLTSHAAFRVIGPRLLVYLISNGHTKL